jgi:hypothetical protein
VTTGGPLPAARAERAGLAWSVRLALILAACLPPAGFLVLWTWGDALESEFGFLYWVALAVLVAAVLVGAFALRRRWRDRGRAGGLLAWAFALAVLTQAALIAGFPSQREPYVALGAGLAAGLFGAIALSARDVCGGGWARARRALFGVALALCAAELLLRLVAVAFQPALLAEASDVAGWIASHRLRPGSVRLGFPVNARGFYDVEPPAARSGRLVAVIGDSFGVGTVPHSLHYTSVAERELPGHEFYNVGVAGADPRHYLTLLTEEVRPLDPDLVVVALFIGNDLCFDQAQLEHSGALDWVGERRASALARLAGRLAKLQAETGRRRREGGAPSGEGTALVAPARVSQEFPWVLDPMLEVPTFSAEAFLKIERQRVLDTTAPSEAYPAFPWLERLVRAAGTVPLLFLLIPDEFQVEDALWDELTTALGATPERDHPQRVVGRFCAERGSATLDLLPALRAAEPLADGRLHVYALRDTHWNARGNAIAGRELARAVRARLGP